MDSVWAAQRRKRLTIIIGSVLGTAFVLYIGIGMYRPPTCFDGSKNQGELGADCGGPCARLCASQVGALNTLWVRPFEVSPGWWSALAYVENPNFDAYAYDVPYRITLYDAQGTQILAREGVTFMSGEPALPVFVGRLNVGDREPYRAELTWLSEPVWLRRDKKHEVLIEQQKLTTSASVQEITAFLRNDEPIPLDHIEIVAIVYDRADNAIAVSETYIEHLAPRAKQEIVFSWPQAFPGAAGRIEIIPRVPMQE